LIGVITPYDLLKAKQWEYMQELREPGQMSVFALARFRSKTARRAREEDTPEPQIEEPAPRSDS
jgi:hypothetical protein